MRMHHMRSWMLRPSSPKAGSTTNPGLSPTLVRLGAISGTRVGLTLFALQTPRSLRSGMMRKTVTGSPLLFPTPSAWRPLVAANGNGMYPLPCLSNAFSNAFQSLQGQPRL